MSAIPDLVPLYDSRPGVRSLLEVEVRDAALAGAATLDFVASTATLDRYHEVIEPSGWRLDAYRRNPVFQNAHNYGDILFTLGKALVTEVRTVGDRQALCQRIEFAVEVNPVARIAYGLYKGGFLNAVSVGFIPLKWEEPNVADGTNGTGRPRRRYVEQELLEVSAVAIPANPDALAMGVKSGAVTRADLQETFELVRSLMSRESDRPATDTTQLFDLARELGRVMRKA